mgnify:CR=1 FL=1
MKLLWIYLLILFVVIGCSKETDCTNSDCIEKDCIATMLTKNNMIKYTNDEIGCKMYLELFMYNNKQYFLLGSHCIYMVSIQWIVKAIHSLEIFKDQNTKISGKMLRGLGLLAYGHNISNLQYFPLCINKY